MPGNIHIRKLVTHAQIDTHTHTHTKYTLTITHINTHTHTNTQTHARAHTHTYIHAHAHTHTHTHERIQKADFPRLTLALFIIVSPLRGSIRFVVPGMDCISSYL